MSNDDVGDGPYRTSAKFKEPSDLRVALFIMAVVAGPSLVLTAFMSFMGWYMAPAPEPEPEPIYCEARPISKRVSCPSCPEPVLSHRETGCIALCGGDERVAWFARNNSYGYVCQCVRGPELNRGTRGLWDD